MSLLNVRKNVSFQNEYNCRGGSPDADSVNGVASGTRGWVKICKNPAIVIYYKMYTQHICTDLIYLRRCIIQQLFTEVSQLCDFTLTLGH